MWPKVARRFAALLAGVREKELEEAAPGVYALARRGILIRVPLEELADFAERPYLPEASALVAPALQADASGYRALNSVGRAFGWGTVRQAWVVRQGEPLPQELAPWSSLLQESFRRYKAPVYLIARFTRRAAPLLLPLRRI
jgi:hypothetical protein